MYVSRSIRLQYFRGLPGFPTSAFCVCNNLQTPPPPPPNHKGSCTLCSNPINHNLLILIEKCGIDSTPWSRRQCTRLWELNTASQLSCLENLRIQRDVLVDFCCCFRKMAVCLMRWVRLSLASDEELITFRCLPYLTMGKTNHLSNPGCKKAFTCENKDISKNRTPFTLSKTCTATETGFCVCKC